MTTKLEITYLCVITLVLIAYAKTDNIVNAVNSNLTCYECNTYRGGTLNPCVDEGSKPKKQACRACMKVHTRMEMHDYWNKPRVVTFESFTCVAKDFSIKPVGCYMKTGTRSITKICYCYSNLCNSAGRRGISEIVVLLMVLLSVISCLLL